MKTTEKVLGYGAAFLLFLGAFFKFNHYPGAGILMLLGGLFFIVFSILWLISTLKEADIQIKKVSTFLIFLFMFITMLAFIFKVQHYPGAGILVWSSFGLFILTAISGLIRAKLGETKVDYNYAIILFIVGGVVAFYPTLMRSSVKTADQLTIEDVVFSIEDCKTFNLNQEYKMKVAIPDINSENILIGTDNGTMLGKGGVYTYKAAKAGPAIFSFSFKDLSIGTKQFEVIDTEISNNQTSDTIQ